MNKKWDRRFVTLAKHIAGWSKDPSTQVGAVLAKGNRVVGLGYNGLPAGVKDKRSRLMNRAIRYAMTAHAEANGLAMAGDKAQGATVYTWPLPPCSTCAAALIQAGVRRVVAPTPPPDLAQRWGASLKLAQAMFREAGVKVEMLDDH